MKNLIKQMFTTEDLSAIASAIGEAEKTTAGEIRVSIRQKRKWREKKRTIEELARQEFHILGMTKTKERTGILIFLLLEDKKFFILADEGIHTKVEDGTWDRLRKKCRIISLRKIFAMASSTVSSRSDGSSRSSFRQRLPIRMNSLMTFMCNRGSEYSFCSYS